MSYLSSYIPEITSQSRSVKTNWSGINRSLTQDSGELSDANNVSLREYPFISSEKQSRLIWSAPDGHTVVSVHPTGGETYVVITQSEGKLYFHYIADTVKSLVQTLGDYVEGEVPSVAVFNVYQSTANNIVSATFDRKILLYPYCLSFDPDDEVPSLKSFNTTGNAVPKLKKVTVMNGRVFGVLDGKFYASEWNNYAGWRLNTADDTNSALAWVSTTQSDVDADGEFTAIVTYDGHVIGFKRNFMHMLYNNKTPFRIVDVAKIGAISQEAVCVCDQILFFVSDDGVYSFTGGYPNRISDKLEISSFEGAVLGADDKTLYCYIPSEHRVFTYDTVHNVWGSVDGSPKNCAKVVNSCYFAKDDGIYSFGSGENGDFYFATDASFGGSLAEKKIKRMRFQVLHKEHKSGDYVTVYITKSDGGFVCQKTFQPQNSGTYVLSMLTRMTCSLGHIIRVHGRGAWEFRYLQVDYSPGGENYV